MQSMTVSPDRTRGRSLLVPVILAVLATVLLSMVLGLAPVDVPGVSPDTAHAMQAKCHGGTGADESACVTDGGIWVDVHFEPSDVGSRVGTIAFALVAAVLVLFGLIVTFRFGLGLLSDVVRRVLGAMRGLVRRS